MDELLPTALYLFILLISQCWCLAEFDLFPGFDATITTSPMSTLTPVTSSTSKPTTLSNGAPSTKTNGSTTTLYKPYVCPEKETPYNIGPYEVPSQRDLAVHVKTTLKVKFKSYHKKALFFLNDIKEATKATKEIETKCPSRSRVVYKQCVKHVSNQCQLITKNLVVSLERQRHDVNAFTEDSICNFSSMKSDPVQLIKILAMEEASLEFALAGFLRLLSACSHYCHDYTIYNQKPIRHMSDQDLVIKHFLTRKNYVELLKGTP